MRKNFKSRGFTLVELIVVITLIGILAPGMTLIFSSILDNYRTMNAMARVTKSSEFILSRFTDDINESSKIKQADEKEIEIEINTTPVQTYYYKIDDSSSSIKLCVSSCDDNENFHTIIDRVQPTSQYKYLDTSLDELENSPAKPWLSSNSSHYDKLNSIIYVELKLDLQYLDDTVSYSTVIYPEKKIDL